MLSKYFKAIGAKRLSQVEVSSIISHQHELNGIGEFKRIFGPDKATFATKFISLVDDEDKVKSVGGQMTWYDARENHPTRSEYRLYYSEDEIFATANPGDLLVVAKIDAHKLAAIVAPQGSTSEKQLLWLFGLADLDTRLVVKDLSADKTDIGFAGRYILSTLGFELEETLPDYLELILDKFGMSFPPTKIFSEFSRSTVKDVSPIEAPDETLMAWLEREELLFKTLEKVIIKEHLAKGFGEDGTDVEAFIKLSLSIQNRRKSRAGFSFENNLAVLFTSNKISYAHGATTERNNRPDFIFPGVQYYHNQQFDAGLLTMLGVKTTAKDRWRQVLSEAARIPNKHLITLEPAISRNQTEEMSANNLQLVIPAQIMPTYTSEQRQKVMSVKDFIGLVGKNQSGYGASSLLF